MDTERNLLFAVLAFRAGLIDRGRFAQVCALWANDKTVPIAELLVRRGWLTPADRDRLEGAWVRELAEYRDAARALAAAAGPEARTALKTIADGEVARAVDGLRWRAGRVEVYEEVGRGGAGLVYRGHDPELRRDVAVKVLRETWRGDRGIEERFIREAQIGGRLLHTGIVPVHDLGRLPDGRPYFVMRLFEKGQSLADLLKKRPTPADDQARLLRIFESVCQAVACAHGMHIIHRDLKPANVVGGDNPQVADWGLARILGAGGGAGSEDVSASTIETIRSAAADAKVTRGRGSPAYMAPEQTRAGVGSVDERADVFGLGGILCHILTGRPTYIGATTEQVRQKAEVGDVTEAFARLDSAGADAELVALCKKCLSPNPEDRPRDAGEVVALVAAYRDAERQRHEQRKIDVATARATADKERALRRLTENNLTTERRLLAEERRRRRVQLVLAATVLLAVGVVGGMAWWAQNRRLKRDAELAARRQKADAAALLAMGEARSLLDRARNATALPDMVKFGEARAAARNAEELANAGEASDDVRQQAADLAARTDREEAAAGRARRLVADLLMVRGPSGGPRFQKDDEGGQTTLAEPSADKQFAAAFRAWDASFDVDVLPTAEAAGRVRGLPVAVMTEVIAALDEWASERQQVHAENWQRLAALAAALDENPVGRRAELRALLARDNLVFERVLGQLAMLLPLMPPPVYARLGKDRARLRRLAAEVDPASEPVLSLLTLARALRVAGDDPVAVELLRAALRARPQEVVLHVALGDLLEEQRPPRWAEAVECYAAAQALRPEAREALANAMSQSGRPEALTLYERLVKERPDSPWLQFRWGNALLSWGQYAKAEGAYQEAIRLFPNFQEAQVNLSSALRHQARYEEAEIAAKEAIRLGPDDSAAHNNLATALLKQGRYTQAEAAAEEAIRLRHDNPVAHLTLGNALYERRRFAEAEAAYRQAVRLRPEFATAHYNLAYTLNHRGDLEGAIAEYGKALNCQSDFPQARHNLASALLEQRRYKEAEAVCYEAVRLRPDDAGAHSNLGTALFRQGRFEEAEAAYRRDIRLRPDHAGANFNLGQALFMQGRFVEASAHLRRGHELGRKDPGWPSDCADRVVLCEQSTELERKLPAILRGDLRPSSTAQTLELAFVCLEFKHRNVSASRLYAEAFAAEPKLAEDLVSRRRYNAARSALLAAAAQGEDANLLPDKVVLMLRGQALRWLRADLTEHATEARRGNLDIKRIVPDHLRAWRKDAALTAVHDEEALDRLPQGERRQWREFWADVADLIQQLDEKQ